MVLISDSVRVTVFALAKAFTKGFQAAKPRKEIRICALRYRVLISLSCPVLGLAAKALKNTMNALKPWASAPAKIGKWAGYALKATKVLMRI